MIVANLNPEHQKYKADTDFENMFWASVKRNFAYTLGERKTDNLIPKPIINAQEYDKSYNSSSFFFFGGWVGDGGHNLSYPGPPDSKRLIA